MRNHTVLYIGLPAPAAEEIPTLATHALWSERSKFWYYWRITKEGSEYHTSSGWIRHKNQINAAEKLKTEIVVELYHGEPKVKKQRKNGMNLSNAALLVRDDISTVGVVLSNNPGRTFYCVLHNSLEAQVGDSLCVSGEGKNPILQVEVVDVSDVSKIDPYDQDGYLWVVSNYTQDQKKIQKHIDKTEEIADKLKSQQTGNVRQQILNQFGITDVKTLLE